uniref:Uncharacterized protein n=1 Tax=Mimivirus LCMiAC01 TaxID=2506608 RepID=A0A481YZS2_9VIRU|nr:MAG: uncharacterized protein LCMiAC01_04340 [Mimivirus LCMiAC01]
MNKQKYKIQQYYKNKYKNQLLAKKYTNKRNNDVIYKIIDNLSRRACKYLKKINVKRNMTHIQLIGCSSIDLKKYLQSKFLDNMNYSNYGKWEVDHIKPISLYDLQYLEQIKECFNYKNLQPLWRIDNRKKSNKYQL